MDIRPISNTRWSKVKTVMRYTKVDTDKLRCMLFKHDEGLSRTRDIQSSGVKNIKDDKCDTKKLGV